MDIKQVADVYAMVYFSLDMISNKLHETWQPKLEHLVAAIAALDLDVGLQQDRKRIDTAYTQGQWDL